MEEFSEERSSSITTSWVFSDVFFLEFLETEFSEILMFWDGEDSSCLTSGVFSEVFSMVSITSTLDEVFSERSIFGRRTF